MTFTTLLPIVAVLLLASCEKNGSCQDDELSLSRIDYSGSQIKLDGYYFGNITENSVPPYAEIYFLYRNGVMFTTGASLLEEAEAGTITVTVENAFGKANKRPWGVFQVHDTNIQIDRWQGNVNGCEETIYELGNILNDSTFVITRREYRDNGDATKVETINDTFSFRTVPEKPDSCNPFIN